MNAPLMKSPAFLVLTFLFTLPSFSQLEEGVQLFEDQRFEEAKTFFASYTKDHPEDAEAAYYMGRTLMVNEDYKEATSWFEKAVDLDESNSMYQFRLGEGYGAQAQRAGMLKKASLAKKTKAAFEKAVELDANNLDAREGLLQYYMQAPGIMGGSMEKAWEQTEELSKRDAWRGQLAKADYHNHEENFEAAAQAYRGAIDADPTKVGPYYSLENIYQRQEQFDIAFETLEEGIQAHPDEVRLYYRLARASAVSGQNLERGDEAIKIFLEGEEETGWLAWGHYRQGAIYEHQGNAEAAKTAYVEALKLDPEHEQAQDALKKLK